MKWIRHRPVSADKRHMTRESCDRMQGPAPGSMLDCAVVVDSWEVESVASSVRGTTGISRIQAIFKVLFEGVPLT